MSQKYESAGPGKYDAIATVARLAAKAEGVCLMVLAGEHGSGFSVQIPLEMMHTLPGALREVAAKIEQEFT